MSRLQPPSHRNAPIGTSEVAAEMIAGRSPKLRLEVYEAIVRAGLDGLTDREGETMLGLGCQTYTPRRNELVRLGQVVDSGRRRKTESGRPAAVWVAVAVLLASGTLFDFKEAT